VRNKRLLTYLLVKCTTILTRWGYCRRKCHNHNHSVFLLPFKPTVSRPC